MSRIPITRCAATRKRIYHDEEEAREALARVMVGAWAPTLGGEDFALGVYRCARCEKWHIGHSRKAILAFSESETRRAPGLDSGFHDILSQTGKG